MPDARYLNPATVRVRLPGEGAGPHVQMGEEAVSNAVFRRLFPLSDGESYIALQDAEKNEIGILKSLDGMDDESRRIVEGLLDRQYFTPRVSAIKTLKQEGGMWRFEVETQRGPAEYFVRNWRDSAHEISANRWLVHSVDGQRFEIPNTETLDAASQNLLDQLL